MKVFTKKGITQKIISAVILVTLCNFVFPMYSRADIGGILFDPFANFVVSIGDALLAGLQSFLYDGKGIGKSLISSIFGGVGDLSNYPEMAFSEERTKAVEISNNDFSANWLDLAVDLLGGKNYVIPKIQYSVDKIFAGQIPALDINFISPKTYDGNTDKQQKSISYQISDIIAKWYVSLRNLAVIVLLSILVYMGIRIVISSSADDRAKYKQRIFDWLIAMCLIFFMHYIMLFTVTLVDVLNESIGEAATSIPVRIYDGDVGSGTPEAEFNTNLTGLIRLQVQYNDFGTKAIFMIFYIGILVYTVKFTWEYMRRLITMMFLTIIAPLVAMTYPIDKINDGKAQAFDSWLKEYIFTALIQPFHLIIYTVLVGSSMEIVKTNPIYAIMVIAFIGPAEKMLRKFFGFDKASTPGALSQAGNALGGAAAWDMIKKGVGAATGKLQQGGKPSGGNNNVRTATPYENQNSPDPYAGFIGGNTNSGESTNNEGRELSAQERMLDAYDEKYGTNEYDTAERESMAREANNPTGAEMSREEYAQLLADTGYTQDEIDEDVNAKYGADNENNDNNVEKDEERPTQQTIRTRNDTAESNDAKPAEEAEKGKGTQQQIRTRGRKQTSAKGKPIRAALRGVGSGVKRSVSNTVNDKFKHGNWKRTLGQGALKAGKLAARLAVAGTVGAIGLGVGIAGDDLNDLITYGTAGAALGFTAAPKIGSKIANTGVAREISKSVSREYYGSDAEAMKAVQTRELRESGEMREMVQNNFLDESGNRYEGEELRNLEDRAIDLYNDGFTDKSEIKKVMKFEDKIRKELNNNLPKEDKNNPEKQSENAQRAQEMAESIGKMSKSIDPKKLTNKSYVEEQVERFSKGIKKANPDLTEKQANQNAKEMMNYILKYNKIK